ncbi:hypothetical protein [Bradyrhizobium sp. BR 1432]|uniref:hypothetical protein n=1 Tax=Bradyrhizobium sp. BR 1432 TaxID=3447966 RepID=UPI003EE6C93E
MAVVMDSATQTVANARKAMAIFIAPFNLFMISPPASQAVFRGGTHTRGRHCKKVISGEGDACRQLLLITIVGGTSAHPVEPLNR